MPRVAMGEATEIFELRSASMTLVAFVLKRTDLSEVAAALEERLAPTPDLFDGDAVMIDLSQVESETQPLDFGALLTLLRERRMLPVAVRGGNPRQMAAAHAAGLAEAPAGGAAPQPIRQAQSALLNEAFDAAEQPATVRDAAAQPSDADPAAEAVRPKAAFHGATLVDRPLRSGQQVYARGGDLVVLAAVNFGAEVIADGSIHVYAPLRGKAIAGAKGNSDARIYSTCLDAELVAIAGTYRTTENPLPPEVAGKPAQIRLEAGRLVFEPLA